MAVYGKRLRLGEILTRAGVISEAQLQVALAKQQITREPIGEILIGLGYVTSDQIRNALELQYGVKAITLSSSLNLDLVKLLPEAVIKRLRVVPVAIGQITLAMVDPANMAAVEEVKNRFKGVNVQPVVITETEFKDFLASIPESDADLENSAQEISIDDASAAQLVHVLLSNALARGATELLLEPSEFEARIRMRIDGFLASEPAVPTRISNLLINRLRVLCDLGQGSQLVAQTGSFYFPFEGRKVKATFHALPVKHGQMVTVRFFDPVQLGATHISDLVSLQRVAETLSNLLARPAGLILVNGPQHAIKTGLLYACLKHASHQGRGVVSLEPIIEHELEGISQIHAGSELEGALALGSALKTVLDHGHDFLAVWDLSEPDVARRLVRAALGGRLVLASWNTTERFLEEALETWGLPSRTIANALAGIVNVRAVRALCTACRRDTQPPESTHPLVLRYNSSGRLNVPGEGCERCGYRGFKGEVGVFEVFPFDREMRKLSAGISKSRLDSLAEEEGYLPLAHYAAWLVGQGTVSWDEVAASGIFDDLPPINSESVLV